MEKVKIQDVKTGVVKEVKKALAGDFVGTGNFRIYEEKKEVKSNLFTKNDKKED